MLWFNIKGAFNPIKQEQPSGDFVFLNNTMNIFSMLFAIFVMNRAIKICMDIWKKNKILAILFFISLCVFLFACKFALNMFSIFAKNEVAKSEKSQYIEYITHKRQNKEISNESELHKYLQEEMFFNKNNIKKILELHQVVVASSKLKYYKNIFISGEPGTGKTSVVKKIVQLWPNGGVVIRLSALMEYKKSLKFINANISHEIDEIISIVWNAAKNDQIVVFDDADIFLADRQLEFDEPKNLDEHQENKALASLVGIWCNFWLAIISAMKCTIIIVSNIMHNVKNVIDPANSRRLSYFCTFDLPNEEERLGIFKNYFKNVKFYENKDDIFSICAKLSNNLTGRDIRRIYIETNRYLLHDVASFSLVIDILRSVLDVKNKQTAMKKDLTNKKILEKISKLQRQEM